MLRRMSANACEAISACKEQAMHLPTTIERAFELAQYGPCETLDQVRTQLKRERHESVESHLSGPAIGRQLRALLTKRRVAQPVGAEG